MDNKFDAKEVLKIFYESPFDEVWLTCEYVDECSKKVSRLRYYINKFSRYSGIKVHKNKTRIQIVKGEK